MKHWVLFCSACSAELAFGHLASPDVLGAFNTLLVAPWRDMRPILDGGLEQWF